MVDLLHCCHGTYILGSWQFRNSHPNDGLMTGDHEPHAFDLSSISGITRAVQQQQQQQDK